MPNTQTHSATETPEHTCLQSLYINAPTHIHARTPTHTNAHTHLLSPQMSFASFQVLSNTHLQVNFHHQHLLPESRGEKMPQHNKTFFAHLSNVAVHWDSNECQPSYCRTRALYVRASPLYEPNKWSCKWTYYTLRVCLPVTETVF